MLLLEGLTLREIAERREVSEAAVHQMARKLRQEAGVERTRHLIPVARKYFGLIGG